MPAPARPGILGPLLAGGSPVSLYILIEALDKLTTASCIDTSNTWPFPVVCLCMMAANIPTTPCNPVPLSPMFGPGLSGGPPGMPVTAMAPPAA